MIAMIDSPGTRGPAAVGEWPPRWKVTFRPVTPGQIYRWRAETLRPTLPVEFSSCTERRTDGIAYFGVGRVAAQTGRSRAELIREWEAVFLDAFTIEQLLQTLEHARRRTARKLVQRKLKFQRRARERARAIRG